MVNVRSLSKELQNVAGDELHEEPSRVEANIEAIKEWLAKTPHLKPRTDDQFLVAFLRGCKYSIEKVKTKLDSFYTIRAAIPEMFHDRSVNDDFIKFLKMGIFVPLPKTNGPSGPRIFVHRLTFNPEEFNYIDSYKYLSMLLDIMMLEDDNLVVAGNSFVIDMKGTSMEHLKNFTPTFMKKIMVERQEGNPFRLKNLYYLNMPTFFANILNVLTSFFSEKLRSRVSICK